MSLRKLSYGLFARRIAPPHERKDERMIIAVDFDGTIVEHKYPAIGKPNPKIIDWLKRNKLLGAKLILVSCRNGQYLDDAINFCRNLGIYFDAVNTDVKEIAESDFGKEKSSKIYCDIYLDDRNILIKDIEQDKLL